ncbi:MAG: hypothetical protein DRH57_07720 [Candidatus Cloacimonadota bacterium]|nr:MAG: hypothetical protein DRH57_07720 [Candidatus Cloacimonadota bacterium]
MKDLKDFISMKIETATATIEECKSSDFSFSSDYDIGSNDGYLEATELELQTLNQILDRMEKLWEK